MNHVVLFESPSAFYSNCRIFNYSQKLDHQFERSDYSHASDTLQPVIWTAPKTGPLPPNEGIASKHASLVFASLPILVQPHDHDNLSNWLSITMTVLLLIWWQNCGSKTSLQSCLSEGESGHSLTAITPHISYRFSIMNSK